MEKIEQELVLVKWFDTSSHPGWRESVEGLGLTTAYSLGFLMFEDEQLLKIAATITDEGGIADVTVIPASCVESKTKLKGMK